MFDETTSKGFQTYIANTDEAARSADGLSQATVRSSEAAQAMNSSFQSVGLKGKALSLVFKVISSALTTMAIQATMFAITAGGKWIWENIINATSGLVSVTIIA